MAALALQSFPTRRSSDLHDEVDARRIAGRTELAGSWTDRDPGRHDGEPASPGVLRRGEVADHRDRVTWDRGVTGTCAAHLNNRQAAVALLGPRPRVQPAKRLIRSSREGVVHPHRYHDPPRSP